jgi:hypothetical protein
MSWFKHATTILLTGLLWGGFASTPAKSQEAGSGEVPALTEPSVSTTISDPLSIEQVQVTTGGAKLYGTMSPSPGTAIGCTIQKGAKGTVVAKRGPFQLVAFNQQNWDNSCGKSRGIEGQRLAWVDASALRQVKDLKLEAYGDICSAYTYLEESLEQPAAAQAEGRTEPCKDGNCPQKNPLVAIADQFKEIESFHFGNRCFIEKDAPRESAACSFETMLQEANDCGKDKKGNRIRCGRRECEKRLGRMACQNSPWREKSLQQRFNLIVSMARSYAPKYGVDFRAVPCIATVETGFLEPMAKTLLACGNPNQNRYHGLGMITRSTLDSYISPYKKFVMPGPKGTKIQIGPFRSSIPELTKPSYYACPGKLHDALGSSPELQVELMAYTLAEKLAIAGGSEYNAYKYYNAHAAIDHENGQPHMNNYAQAAQACVACLRVRMPDGKPEKDNPLHCLSAASRGRRDHPFWLKTDDHIERVFGGSMKRYCGEEK